MIGLIRQWNIHTGVVSWQADIGWNTGAANDIFRYAETVWGPGQDQKYDPTEFQHVVASMIQVRLTNEALTPPDVLGLSGISMDTHTPKRKRKPPSKQNAQQRRSKSRQSKMYPFPKPFFDSFVLGVKVWWYSEVSTLLYQINVRICLANF